MNNLKKLIVFLTLIFISIATAATQQSVESSEEVKVAPFEVGLYGRGAAPVSYMSDYVRFQAGGGVEFDYHIFKMLGVKAAVDFSTVNKRDSFIDSWAAMNLLGGVFADIKCTSAFRIQPTCEVGVQFTQISSDYDANGFYSQLNLTAGPTFYIAPAKMYNAGFAITAEPFYSLCLDKNDQAQYVGGKIGVLYHPSSRVITKTVTNTITNVEYVTKEVEVPVMVSEVTIRKYEDGSISIAVPAIGFKADSTELLNSRSNHKTLDKVKEILLDDEYKECLIKIIGYINPDDDEWTEAENELALGRANSVKKMLEGLGISGSRITTEHGSGKTFNAEYNRRVEFKLSNKQ